MSRTVNWIGTSRTKEPPSATSTLCCPVLPSLDISMRYLRHNIGDLRIIPTPCHRPYPKLPSHIWPLQSEQGYYSRLNTGPTNEHAEVVRSWNQWWSNGFIAWFLHRCSPKKFYDCRFPTCWFCKSYLFDYRLHLEVKMIPSSHLRYLFLVVLSKDNFEPAPQAAGQLQAARSRRAESKLGYTWSIALKTSHLPNTCSFPPACTIMYLLLLEYLCPFQLVW